MLQKAWSVRMISHQNASPIPTSLPRPTHCHQLRSGWRVRLGTKNSHLRTPSGHNGPQRFPRMASLPFPGCTGHSRQRFPSPRPCPYATPRPPRGLAWEDVACTGTFDAMQSPLSLEGPVHQIPCRAMHSLGPHPGCRFLGLQKCCR